MKQSKKKTEILKRIVREEKLGSLNFFPVTFIDLFAFLAEIKTNIFFFEVVIKMKF